MAKGKYHEWLEPDGLLLLQGWARDGLTEEQISKNIGIDPSTFRVWKNRFPAIQAAIKKSREIVDREVENALLKSALGAHYTVKKPIKLKKVMRDGTKMIEEEYIDYVEEDVFIPPQNVAQFFWLKNRKPKDWRDKPVALDAEAERISIIDDFR